MHTEQRFRAVYKKIIISYAAVIFLSIFMVSAISHNYAGRMLKDEMISGGSEVILRIGEMLDSRVFARAEAMWLECAARDAEISHAIDHPNDVSLYDYYKLCQKLYYLASENNDIVSSVKVYCRGT